MRPDDARAARQVDAIRQAGLTWIRWRNDCAVRAPTELPDRAWIERLRATLSARPEVRKRGSQASISSTA